MQTSLLNYIRAHGYSGDAISYILPRLAKTLGNEFCVFADCGAGIGHTATKYAQTLDTNLPADAKASARVFCYEPLPENLAELTPRLKSVPFTVLRPVAVGETATRTSFVVPRRMTGDGAVWSAGTSAVGFLGSTAQGETIEVDVVRLDAEPVERFDFVKLDLQGGERAALRGLGKKLADTKLIYAEHQMLGSSDYGALTFLQQQGFVCYMDKIQFGIRLGSYELPFALLAEVGITVERVVPPDTRGMSRDYMLFGYIDDTKTKALSAAGLFGAETIKRLRDAGVTYLQTDVIAINPVCYGKFLSAI